MTTTLRRYAHTVFCDDLRIEINGKLSIIGMYGDQMIVPALPFIQPRLVIFTWAAVPLEQMCSRVVVRVHHNDQQIAETSSPLPDLSAAEVERRLADARAKDGAPRFSLKSRFELTPFLIEQAGVLRVRVWMDEEEIRAGAMQIVQGEVPANPFTAPVQPSQQ